MTFTTQGHAPNALYERVRQQFTEQELVNLTLAVVTINGWDRLAISFRFVPGSSTPHP
jgi:alkylhydroperoxidase family enzyme